MGVMASVVKAAQQVSDFPLRAPEPFVPALAALPAPGGLFQREQDRIQPVDTEVVAKEVPIVGLFAGRVHEEREQRELAVNGSRIEEPAQRV
jgi:hypothetical protein